jgi:serine/threonine-protein kinase
VIPNGTLISGKWYRRQYKIEKLIGEGANGRVYLVSRGSSLFALKTGREWVDHQSEVNVLKSLSAKAPAFRGFIVDSDDMEQDGQKVPYYVMKYVKGKSPTEFIKTAGKEWLRVIGLNLLQKLNGLHRQGYIFGDLKVENVIVGGYGEVELVDFGGVTAKGNAVKQFTEVYDRGYWSAGTRLADEQYDLFSFAVFCLQLAKPPRTTVQYAGMIPQNRSVDFLIEEVRNTPELAETAPCLEKALRCRYSGTNEALQEWRSAGLRMKARRTRAGRRGIPWLKFSFATILVFFVWTIYYYW